MTEQDIECILERARERFPGAQPRIIADNGPQFISRDFKTYIRITGMTHVRTAPYYPQSNGKIERINKTIKSEAIRIHNPDSLDEACKVVENFVHHYNNVRLHSAIRFVTPSDMAEGRAEDIWRERDRKLEAAQFPGTQVSALTLFGRPVYALDRGSSSPVAAGTTRSRLSGKWGDALRRDRLRDRHRQSNSR